MREGHNYRVGDHSNRKQRLRSLENLEARRLLSTSPGLLHAGDVNAALVTTFSGNHVRVRESGKAYFISTERLQITPPNGHPQQVLSEDFNGDGVVDLLAIDDAGEWWLQLNDGTRLFEFPVGSPVPSEGEIQILDAADFDQDGRLDVVSVDEAGNLWVSKNERANFQHENWGEFAHPTGWSELFVGDFSGDGLPDVLGGEVGGNWWLAKNTGAGDFDNYKWGRFADFDWETVIAAEVTGDAATDVIARAPDNTWWTWQGGQAGFEPARYFGHWKMRDRWSDVATGDFNGDNIDDVIGRADDGTLWVASAHDGTFNTWQWASGWIDSARWSQVRIMDINGDGLDDQIGHAQDDTWWYALNSGNRFFNSYWSKGGEADFVVQDFVRPTGIDIIDSLPVGGKDPRNGFTASSVEEDVVDNGPIRNSGRHGNNNLSYFSSLATLLRAESVADSNTQPTTEPVDTNESVDGESETDPSCNGPGNCYPLFSDVTAKVVDGTLVLVGSADLAGIQVSSQAGRLSLETIELPIRGEVPLADPFPPSVGIILQNRSDAITIGSLGFAASVTDETETSIRYSGSAEDAVDDLTVEIGIGAQPFRLRVLAG